MKFTDVWYRLLVKIDTVSQRSFWLYFYSPLIIILFAIAGGMLWPLPGVLIGGMLGTFYCMAVQHRLEKKVKTMDKLTFGISSVLFTGVWLVMVFITSAVLGIIGLGVPTLVTLGGIGVAQLLAYREAKPSKEITQW